jgi:hypothetical protein
MASHRSQGKRKRHFERSGSLQAFCDAVLTPESYERLTSEVHNEVDAIRKKKGLKPMQWKKKSGARSNGKYCRATARLVAAKAGTAQTCFVIASAETNSVATCSPSATTAETGDYAYICGQCRVQSLFNFMLLSPFCWSESPSMPRGGKRPNAGRKARPTIPLEANKRTATEVLALTNKPTMARTRTTPAAVNCAPGTNCCRGLFPYPLGFPWGEGELEGVAGPRKWQREAFELHRGALLEPGDALHALPHRDQLRQWPGQVNCLRRQSAGGPIRPLKIAASTSPPIPRTSSTPRRRPNSRSGSAWRSTPTGSK